MRRICDEQGLDSDGKPSIWQDVATFTSYNDAGWVLSLLVLASDPKG